MAALTAEIDLWIIDKSCMDIKWIEMGIDTLHVSICDQMQIVYNNIHNYLHTYRNHQKIM